jgi:hypothetical protein
MGNPFYLTDKNKNRNANIYLKKNIWVIKKKILKILNDILSRYKELMDWVIEYWA